MNYCVNIDTNDSYIVVLTTKSHWVTYYPLLRHTL